MERKEKIARWKKRTQKWRQENKIILNKIKSKEIYFFWGKFATHMLKIIRKKNKKSHIMSRLSTLLNSKIKDKINKLDNKYQPSFLQCDRKMKEKIFGYEGKKSFISGYYCCGIGDHIFGIRELIKTQGIAGSNSQWNLIPVTHSENVSYKRAEIKEKKRNLAFETLTSDEILQLSSNQKDIYIKIKNWKKYVKSRNARMFYPDMHDIDNENKDFILSWLILTENHTLNQQYTMKIK